MRIMYTRVPYAYGVWVVGGSLWLFVGKQAARLTWPWHPGVFGNGSKWFSGFAIWWEDEDYDNYEYREWRAGRNPTLEPREKEDTG